jgi:hypothetical protein
MLKKLFSSVLASLKVSTYGGKVRLDLSLAVALLKCILNIRNHRAF